MKSPSDGKPVFDQLDRDLIAILRRDGRAPLSKLADILGVSRGTVQNRLDRLTETGGLLGFTIRVREDYATGSIRAIMLIEVVGKSTTEVIRKLRGFTELQALHTTNGKWDLIVELGAQSLTELDAVLRRIRLIPGITASETNLLLATPRTARGRP